MTYYPLISYLVTSEEIPLEIPNSHLDWIVLAIILPSIFHHSYNSQQLESFLTTESALNSLIGYSEPFGRFQSPTSIQLNPLVILAENGGISVFVIIVGYLTTL